ncbi:TlpA disulfide reductase family protein [Pedobacter sp. GR22-6]|uniref:TlpA disulfide reductase family protein n=1 Tax=Pedobacter sp. GR22-6 TaxID=3127957 RepID=UPI00307E20C5
MKKMILVLLMALPLVALSQDSYKIIGTFRDLSTNGKIFMRYKSAGLSRFDSTVVKNGAFEMSGKMTNIVRASLQFINAKHVTSVGQRPKADMLTFYLEKATIKIFVSDSLKNAVLSGSKVNQDDRDLKKMMEPLQSRLRSLRIDYHNLEKSSPGNKPTLAIIQKQIDQICEKQLAMTKYYVHTHPDSYISLFAVREIAGPYSDNIEAAKLFSTLSREIRGSIDGKDMARALKGVNNTAVGRIAPEFSQPDTVGRIVKLSDFRGKYVFVDFWASWCHPCRAENPKVITAFNNYKDKGFTVIGISIDKQQTRDAWLKAIQDDGLPWIQLIDPTSDPKGAAAVYGIRSIPSNFLIDPNGVIIARNLRGDDLQKKLESTPDLNSPR